MLGEAKGAEAEVLRYHRSRGALGAKERVELRTKGTAERAGPDIEKLVGPSRARTKLDQDMRSMDVDICKCVKNEKVQRAVKRQTAGSY